jgi:transposase-like protein
MDEDDNDQTEPSDAFAPKPNTNQKKRVAVGSSKSVARKEARESRFVCANCSKSWKRESTLLKHTQEKSCQPRRGGVSE